MHQDDTDPELDLFRSAMRDVRPLSRERHAMPGGPRPAPIPRQRIADDRAVLSELLQPPTDDYELGVERGEAAAFLRPGLQRRVLRKLKRGQYSVGAEIDLHGTTVAVAKRVLDDFLADCHRHHLHCVRIIHGKGRRSSNRGPVLKGKVDHWLRRRADVLAFCSARPVDGGTGALYVLLSHP